MADTTKTSTRYTIRDLRVSQWQVKGAPWAVIDTATGEEEDRLQTKKAAQLTADYLNLTQSER